jgi:uncharacterized Zn-binding protein involved in type VI secretion
MSTGYYIGLGDKTECGGQVIEGDQTISWDGLIHALEGHLATCGKDLKAYPICGGISSFTNNGRRVAGTLDSFSGCPCRARLLPSVFTASYEGEASPSLPSNAPTQPSLSPHTLTACDERFCLIDEKRQPLGLLEYALLQGNQCIAVGKLDGQGHSSSFESPTPTSLNLAIRAPSPVME